MEGEPAERHQPRILRLARSLALLPILLGAVALIGWALDITALKSLLAGLAEMKANTALGSILGGIALWWLVSLESATRNSANLRIGVLGAGVLMVLIGGLTLAEYAFGWELQIDQLFFRDPSDAPFTEAPGRMARNTAFTLALLGGAFATWDWGRASSWRLSHWLALAATAISMAGLVGYLFSVTVLLQIASFTGMSVQTSLALLALSAGLLLMQEDSVVMRVINAPGPGGLLARRMAPAILILPLFLGWARLLLEEFGLIEAGSGVSAMVAALVLFQALVLYVSVAEMEELEESRRVLEEASERSRESIRLSRERLLAAINASEAAIFEYRTSERVLVFQNERTAEMLGFTMASLPGNANFLRWFLRRIHIDDRQRVIRSYANFIAAEPGPHEIEFRARHEYGHWVSIRAFLRALDSAEHATVDRFIGVLFDVSSEKAREATLQNAVLAADGANRAKTDFMATMSHELRTPLNAIIGYTDLLLAGVPEPLPDRVVTSVTRIALSSDHLRSLIEEVLTFAGLEAGREVVHIDTVSVQQLIDEIDAIIEPLARQVGLTLTCDSSAGPEALVTDARKLRQILVNLLGNALKFTTSGEVRLVIAAEADQVLFAVSDTGPGLKPAELEEIFEPFFQAEHSRRGTASGAGLGLAISRRYASMLGGTIEVKSAIGEGSVFTLAIPREIDGPVGRGSYQLKTAPSSQLRAASDAPAA